MADSQNGNNRTNPQTPTTGNTYGYPGQTGSGKAVINKAPAKKMNGKGC